MTYYIFIEDNKINGAGQARILNEETINFEVTEEVYNNFIKNPNRYTWDGSSIIENSNFLDEEALKQKTYLTESINYPLKAEIAYTGVRFDYNGEELIFETNKDSMSLISTTLVGVLTSQLTMAESILTVDNWKCRKTVEPFEPVSVTFTIEQFTALVNFAKAMIGQAFAVEEQINKQIQEMTTEQLNNPEFIMQAELQMKEAYKKVPVKLEGLFS